MFRILIAEDDVELQQLFCRVLRRSGFEPIPVNDGQEALEMLDREIVDLIVSDIMMPRVDGYELVQTLRDAGSNIPVLMITAKDRFQDMQMGFLSGTDDYMVKPVNVNEMVLRVQALLRRAQMINDRKQTIGDTVMECDSLTVTVAGESMILPQKEFMLLYKMAAYPGKIFTRQQLMDEIWGMDYIGDTRTVDSHVARIRTKLGEWGNKNLVTVYGTGYKVND